MLLIKLVLLVSLETVLGGCAMVAVAVVFGWWLDAIVDGALLLISECVVFEPVGNVVLSWLLVDDCVAVVLPSSLLSLMVLKLLGTVCGVGVLVVETVVVVVDAVVTLLLLLFSLPVGELVVVLDVAGNDIVVASVVFSVVFAFVALVPLVVVVGCRSCSS